MLYFSLMNKKTIVLSIGFIFVVACSILYFIFKDNTPFVSPVSVNQKTECLVFQSQYPERDCFRIETETASLPVITTKTSYPCNATNAIEAEDCVIKEVQKSKAIDKCADLEGVAKERCLGVTTIKPSIDTSIISIKKPIVTTPSQDPVAPAVPLFKENPISSVISTITNSVDPELTLDGFLARLKESYPVRLYNFSDYQVAPGTEVQAYGINFDKADNTLVIGGTKITGLASTDGFTLTFKAPALSNGTYDAYVENKNGTSQNSGQKVSIVITSSPAPRPVIQSASPSPALPTDSVTLSGQNLLSGSNLVTTLGALSSVSADGTSIRFNISDLDKTKELIKSGQLKGQVFPLMIYVQNGNGVNKDYFVLNVQF